MDLKARINHSILNIFTILNLLLEKNSISKAEKRKMMDMIQFVSLLIGHQDILLGKKPKFFLQEVCMREFLEFTLLIYEEKIQSRHIRISLPPQESFSKIDRYYLGEALSLLLSKLTPEVTFLDFTFDPQKNLLCICHDATPEITPSIKSFEECLQEKNMKCENISYQIALHIFATYASKPIILKGNICISLSSK